jgi:hypothetical protein
MSGLAAKLCPALKVAWYEPSGATHTWPAESYSMTAFLVLGAAWRNAARGAKLAAYVAALHGDGGVG